MRDRRKRRSRLRESADFPAGSGGRGPLAKGKRLAVIKVTWRKVGRVSDPGRYMFTFGWLTITAEDLAVWERFPNAAFTLVKTAETDEGEEFHLGVFELPDRSSLGDPLGEK
jgi:hypothetical protein